MSKIKCTFLQTKHIIAYIYICVCSAKNYNAYMDKIRKDKSTMELTVLVYFWVN